MYKLKVGQSFIVDVLTKEDKIYKTIREAIENLLFLMEIYDYRYHDWSIWTCNLGDDGHWSQVM